MKYKKKPKKEYVLYQGDDILSIGTMREIAEDMGVKEATISYYGTPTYKKKNKRRKRQKISKNRGRLNIPKEDNMKAPCYNCKDRELGCHSSCNKYSEYRSLTEKARNKQKEDSIMNGHVALTRNRFDGHTIKER